MGKILSIDTATDICSVALGYDGSLVDKMESGEDRSHSKVLTVLIQQILEKNNLTVDDLDAIAVSEGPGSYTGLRIGVSAAKGMCYVAKKPLIAVSTLKTIAAGYIQTQEFAEGAVLLPMLDARRMEIYYAEYDKELSEKIEATPLVVEDNSFDAYADCTEVVFVGSGAQKCSEIVKLKNAVFSPELPNKAEYMVGIAEHDFIHKRFSDVAYFEPAYLKPFIATQPKNKIF
jgi:tRNA threonylcarbamoyladenosine biosynthesis protein TsaB